MSATHPLDAELRDLWSRRRNLDEAGWTRLYEISATVLMNYKPRELAGLPEDRDVYILEFFQDKVFRLDLVESLRSRRRLATLLSALLA
jgi:hypothetical protein